MQNENLKNKLIAAHKKLQEIVERVPAGDRKKKQISFTGGLCSVCDILAYQVGWGTLLLGWYRAGLKNEMPVMPCKGFDWDYNALADHFYTKYNRNTLRFLKNSLEQIVDELGIVIEKETQSGNLDKLGVWPWCRLKSGKEWTLSKWIQVNTIAPYTRATSAIRKNMKLNL